ncbi:MAG: class I SAM-dependent rRNA methyltransferase [Deltaproteobacteria bacterium]|nr:class I SAM-dependent rRNA methyltransferase [Deltaproteobacteria bacterium]MBI3295660.1 class I SAM-dependent rRNA methyltransferase [Deltaproteobacteria bacterium]
MKSRKFQFQRYQLTKQAAAVVRSGHPWIFKSHLSTAADVIPAGQWLGLVDSENRNIGFGLRESQGAIGIRVFSQKEEPTREFWAARLDRAIQRRDQLLKYTDGFRLLHGENDGVPGVVIDVYRGNAMLQTYSPTVDSLGRYMTQLARQRLGFSSIVWRLPAKRRRETEKEAQILFGYAPEIANIREGGLKIAVPILSGQKGGAFLDLRNLRKWISLRKDLGGKRVLNLFSYTGTLGLAAETAGAREIWNVDRAKPALEFGRVHHSLGKAKVQVIEADVFRWIRSLNVDEKFDLIIVDPPQMASAIEQVPKALAMYKTLYHEVLKNLSPGGRIVAACCTSRIKREQFEDLVQRVLGRDMKLEANLKAEDDHPVGFPEGDYLKIVAYRARS